MAYAYWSRYLEWPHANNKEAVANYFTSRLIEDTRQLQDDALALCVRQ